MRKNIAIKIASLSLAGVILAGSLVSCADAGLSAYEIALKNGTTTAKTEEEWLATLAGKDGAEGKSAYELACANGYTGTVDEWIASLKGEKGDSGEDGKDGRDGKSAYEVALANGYSGTEAEWISELLGNRTESGTGSGVGIESITVNAQKHLIVRLTNNTTIDAGYIGISDSSAGGSQSSGSAIGSIDSDGYTVVNQTVKVTAGALNIRSTPSKDDNNNVVAYVDQGVELQRVGIGTGDNTWSKVMYKGVVCYASTKYLEVVNDMGAVDLTGVDIPKVNLLDSYTVLVGKETSFEVDQFVVGLASDMYTSFTYSGSGNKLISPDSIAITPTATETADLTFTIRKYINGTLATIYSKTVKIVSVAKTDKALTGLVIGDSRISDGTLVDTLKSTLGSSLTLIGTLKTGSNNPHEGRAGWSAANFVTYEKTAAYTNAFYNPSTKKFDFSYYLTSTSQSAPDFVVINLGANDGYTAQSVNYIKDMVDSVKAYNTAKSASVKVFVMTEYLAPLDNYLVNYAADIALTRELQFEYLGKLSDALAGIDGVYIVPNYIVVDNAEDRPTTIVASETVINDTIHLNASGYKKEALMLAAAISAAY